MGDVIRPYFLGNEPGLSMTRYDRVRYVAMIIDFFWPDIHAMDVNDAHFSEQDVTFPTACQKLAIHLK